MSQISIYYLQKFEERLKNGLTIRALKKNPNQTKDRTPNKLFTDIIID